MRLSIIILCSFLIGSLHAQLEYKVIKVNGSIVYVRTGSSMAQGDVFGENEDLDFATPNSRAAVINPVKGRFILTPGSYNLNFHVLVNKNEFIFRINIEQQSGLLNHKENQND